MNTANFGRVGVLYGGLSAEREVSIMSGKGVYEALLSKGVDAHLFDTGKHSIAELAQQNFDRVFIALHGRYGEDGTIQGALELLGIPYTGSGPMASSLAMDKSMTKKVWLHEGLPTPEYIEIKSESDLGHIVQTLGMPLIIKPISEGSTIGLTKVETESELANAYQLASSFDSRVMAERFIEGRELTVPVLGNGANARALPIIEIQAPGGNYDYEHKYHSDATKYLCPAPISADLTSQVQDLAVKAYQTIGCEGWGRADFMVDANNRPWLLEINTSPGMTGHSLVPMSAAATGMDYPELCIAILAEAACKVSATEISTHKE